MCGIEFTIPQNGLEGLVVNIVLQNPIDTNRASFVSRNSSTAVEKDLQKVKIRGKLISVVTYDVMRQTPSTLKTLL